MEKRLKTNKKRKWIRYSLMILGVVIIGLSAYLYNLYSNVASAVDTMNKPIDRKVSDKREDEIKFNRKDPISILLVGVDEREGDSGRTDSMLVLTLNPKLKTSKLISIPRDTRAELINKDGKTQTYDKMNHAYAFGGIEMTINSIENFLNIPIDYYVEVNMEGFRDIVNAVGGIDVDNQFDFWLDGVALAKGYQHLNGEQALVYARMRKEDPRGDFGRQERQREVITKVIEKGTSLKALTNYNDILKALEKNMKTNLTLDDMLGIQKIYKPAVETIEKIEINGSGGLISNGKQNIWYYIVNDETRQDISNQLREHLGLPVAKIKPNTSKNNIETNKNTETQVTEEPIVTPPKTQNSTGQTSGGSSNQPGSITSGQTSSGTNQTNSGTSGQTGGSNNPPDTSSNNPTGGNTGTDQTDGGSNNQNGSEQTPPSGTGSNSQTGTNGTSGT